MGNKLLIISAGFLLVTGLIIGVILITQPQIFKPLAQAPTPTPTIPSIEEPTFTVEDVTQAIVWIYNQIGNQFNEVEIDTLRDQLDENGHYQVTFSFKKGPRHTDSQEIQLLIAIERDRCPEPSGQTREQSIRYKIPNTWAKDGYCFVPWEDDEYHLITLNSSNSYYQELTTTTTQVGSVACGSFQTDIWILSLDGSETFSMKSSLGNDWINNNCSLKRLSGYQLSFEGKTYANACMINAWGNLKTGKDLASCVPLPTNTPTLPPEKPTSTPTPSTCPTPATVENLKIVCPICEGG